MINKDTGKLVLGIGIAIALHAVQRRYVTPEERAADRDRRRARVAERDRQDAENRRRWAAKSRRTEAQLELWKRPEVREAWFLQTHDIVHSRPAAGPLRYEPPTQTGFASHRGSRVTDLSTGDMLVCNDYDMRDARGSLSLWQNGREVARTEIGDEREQSHLATVVIGSHVSDEHARIIARLLSTPEGGKVLRYPRTVARLKPEYKESRPAWDHFLDNWLKREGWSDGL